MKQIIGIVLVKNEDTYIRSAITNVLDFCDIIIVLDNGSTDQTFPILEEMQKTYPEKIELHTISNALLSHGFIEKYANTDTWIFAVDGDELYDPERLAVFRQEILSGTYDKYWKIFGNCIHIEKIDQAEHMAYGYYCPPSRSITKLYNFNTIISWNEYTERLHGTKMRFKESYNENSVLLLHDMYTWDNSPFRCLHMCFVSRSSQGHNTMRLNPLENLKPLFPIINLIRNLMHGHLSLQSSYKLKKYRRGGIQKVSIEPFF